MCLVEVVGEIEIFGQWGIFSNALVQGYGPVLQLVVEAGKPGLKVSTVGGS